jgi:hypothetical protein
VEQKEKEYRDTFANPTMPHVTDTLTISLNRGTHASGSSGLCSFWQQKNKAFLQKNTTTFPYKPNIA